jgi:hypothetical protein
MSRKFVNILVLQSLKVSKPMGVSVEYNLTGRGWAECIVEIDQHQVRITASYLSNALDDLLDAVAAIVQGANEATASFTEEPGEYRWRFKRILQDRLSIQIIWFSEAFKARPDLEGEIILDAECRMRTFAGAVLSASQGVLATYGLEGYKEKWAHDFPIALQAKLQKALR